MITLLIIVYLNKHKKQASKWLRAVWRYMYINKRVLLLLLGIVLCSKLLHAQTLCYEFEVRKGNRSIGKMNLTQIRDGLSYSMIMLSEVKYRFILLFQASSKETATFHDGILTHSTIYRQETGSKTFNQQTKRQDNIYVIISDGKPTYYPGISPIVFHILCMYSKEPVNIREVFIDKVQQIVPIKKMAEHHYRIELADGNYNDYFYTNGNCTLIRVHQGILDVEIVSKPIKST